MPKRSNRFQRLVTLLYERLGPGWTVEESALLCDSAAQCLREVDIVARGTVATHSLILSVECRDHARPADVSWIDSMAKKHEYLPTSKLVLWSRAGFSRAARTKAKSLKIDTVSQDTVGRVDWGESGAHVARRSVTTGHTLVFLYFFLKNTLE